MNMLARICALLLGLMLSACGGGGGGAGTPIVGGGAGSAVFVSCSSSVVIEVNRALECTIGSGKAPYTVSSSDISVATAGKTTDVVFAISGVRAGTASVTVKDASGSSTVVSVTVGNATPLFLSAPSQVALSVGSSQSFVIGGGAGPYLVAVSNGAVASATVTGSALTVTGLQSGSTTLVVTDSTGAKVPEVNVSVGGGQNTVPLYTTAASPLIVAPGSTPTFDVGGGVTPYRATSSDLSVAEVAISPAGKLSITGRGPGNATVLVTDAAGSTKSVAVTVGSASVVALYTTAPSELTLKGGSTQSFAIGGGVGPYAASSGNASAVAASVTGGALQLQALAAGTANVSVFDSQGRSVTVRATVPLDLPQALTTTAPSSLVFAPGSSGAYTISGGVSPYTVTTNNASVASVTQTTNNFTISGTAVGSAQIQVADSVGTKVAIAVAVASPTPLYVSSAAAVSLSVGTTQTYQVGGGTPGYTVSSSNTSVVTASLSGTTLTLSALSTGTATVVVRDAVGGTQSVSATAAPAVALFTTAPAAITVAPASTQTYAVGGGVGPYTAASSNTAVATVAVSGSTLTINGVAAGTGTVSVRDSAGTLVSVGVTVNSTATQALTVTPAVASGTVAETLSFAIRGGDAPYTVTANNAAVAAVNATGNTFTANLLKAGQTTISVIDSRGQIQAVTLTVAPAPGTPLFVSSAPAVSLSVGTTQTYQVGGGTPGYTVSSSNTSVVTASLSGTTLTLSALSTGTATVVVRDAVGGTQSVSATAAPAVALFTTAPAAITVAPASTQTYAVGGGVGPYTATSSNTAVAAAAVSGSMLTINGVAAGTANVSLRDSLGVAVPLSITVNSVATQALAVSPVSAAGTVGDNLTITMYGGDPPYTVTPANTSVASMTSQNANRFVLDLLRAGATTVTVSDSAGQLQAVNITVAPAPTTPLSLSVPSAVTLSLGADRTAVISGGVAPYTVGSSNEAVVRVARVGGVLTLTPTGNGTAVVQVNDSAGASLALSVTVGTNLGLFTTAPPNLTMVPATSQTFTISGGTSPYFAESSNRVAAIASASGSILTITGVASGNATVAVRDSLGANVNVGVTVGGQTPLFVSAPSSVVMAAGTTQTFTVGGGSPTFVSGTPSYAVNSSDVGVVTAASSGGVITVTAVGAGTSTVTVTDALGARSTFGVTVGSALALHTTAPASITVAPGLGGAQTYEIRGGAAPYVVATSNASVLSGSVSGSSLTVTGVSTGSANLVVTDRLGASVTIAVTVSATASPPLSVTPLAATGTVTDVLRFEIRGGTPVYTATVNNQGIAAASVPGAATSFTLTLNAPGATSVAVIDANGQVQNIAVTILSAPATPLYTSAPANVSLSMGVSSTFAVGGGTGSYVFTSSDTSVLTVPGTSSTAMVLTPVGVGTATVSVTDTAGSVVSFVANVGPVRPLVLSAGSAVTMGVSAGSSTYAILGGRSPYRAESSNRAVVTVAPPGPTSDLILTPAALGTANIIVTDAIGTQVSLAVTVSQTAPPDMAVSPPSASANVGDQLVFSIVGGTPPYTVNANNPGIADRILPAPGPSTERFRMLNAGATTITVFDVTGQVAEVPLTVTQAATQLRMSPTTLLLPETYLLGVAGAATNVNLTVFGGTGPFYAFTTDPRRTALAVSGSVVQVSRGTGTGGTMCSDTDVTKYSLASTSVTDPTQPATQAFDVVITVVDSLGASATTKLVIVDDGANTNPTTTCRP